jgi:hypothetical protein
MALASGKSVRWVADQLGHSSPMLTLKTYAHARPEEEADLSFADFANSRGSRRLYPSPMPTPPPPNDKAPAACGRGPWRKLEHETGLEPATSTLATWCSTN